MIRRSWSSLKIFSLKTFTAKTSRNGLFRSGVLRLNGISCAFWCRPIAIPVMHVCRPVCLILRGPIGSSCVGTVRICTVSSLTPCEPCNHLTEFVPPLTFRKGLRKLRRLYFFLLKSGKSGCVWGGVGWGGVKYFWPRI